MPADSLFDTTNKETVGHTCIRALIRKSGLPRAAAGNYIIGFVDPEGVAYRRLRH